MEFVQLQDGTKLRLTKPLGKFPRVAFGLKDYDLNPIPKYQYWIAQVGRRYPKLQRFKFIKSCVNALRALRGRVTDAERTLGFKEALAKIKPLMAERSIQAALKDERTHSKLENLEFLRAGLTAGNHIPLYKVGETA